MKKRICALVLFVFAAMGIQGQTSPKDLILLLDTSASMSSSYEDVSGYISGAFLQEHLRLGDTFHFIPFSDRPRVDIARRVEGRGELETVIGRMLLQYPLDSWSDISAALSFADEYAAELPARPKKIVLVSDGVSSPPAGSSSETMNAAAVDNLINETKTRFSRRGISLDYIKVTPGQPLPKYSRPSANRPQQTAGAAASTNAPPSASTQSTGAQPTTGVSSSPEGARPADRAPPAASGTAEARPASSGGLPSSPAKPTDTAPAAPAVSTGQSSPVTSAAQTSTQDTPPAGENRAEVPAANTGETAPSTPEQHETETDRQTPAGVSETTGQSEPEQRPEQIPSLSAPAEQPDPTSAEINASAEPADGIEKAPAQTSAAKWDGLPPALLIGLALAGLAALILIILLLSRRLHRSPNRAMARAASPAEDEPAEEPPPFTDHSAELASYAASQKRRTTPYDDRRPVTAPLPADYSGPVTLNLFVEDQNTFIGKRNIHSVKPGHTFTIGGGNSDYLIFLVPVPPAIGEIRVEGNNCTFTPRKPKYFPDIGSQQVSNCIGKTIRIVSDKNYELRFRFERYEDPLHALNKLLNSVKVPG